MDVFEDYYEILQVHPSAEPEVIEAAYRKLAGKYHPDRNPSPTAEEKMKKLNLAREILSDPEKRKRYDAEWFQKKGSAASSARGRAFAKPKPVFEPTYIKFKNVKAGEVKKVSFLVFNAGGPYSKIQIGNTQPWLTVLDYHSLTSTNKLPLKVNIQAQGTDWNTTYSGYVKVKLDEVEATLPVELQTRMKILLKDHGWHVIEYENLKDWVKRRRDRLDAGEELKGRMFRYRFNRSTGKYQIRLRYRHNSGIYEP